MSELTSLLIQVSRRLLISLGIPFMALVLIIAVFPRSKSVVPLVVYGAGLIGGFVGLQRRLKELTIDDLQMIANSWVYTCLSPLIGGVLALLIYIISLSGLLAGQLFPKFVPDPAPQIPGFSAVFNQHAEGFQDYAKLLFWAFLSGFSERFVTNVLSRFEGAAIKDSSTIKTP